MKLVLSLLLIQGFWWGIVCGLGKGGITCLKSEPLHCTTLRGTVHLAFSVNGAPWIYGRERSCRMRANSKRSTNADTKVSLIFLPVLFTSATIPTILTQHITLGRDEKFWLIFSLLVCTIWEKRQSSKSLRKKKVKAYIYDKILADLLIFFEK